MTTIFVIYNRYIMQNDLYQFILLDTVYTDIYWYLCDICSLCTRAI